MKTIQDEIPANKKTKIETSKEIHNSVLNSYFPKSVKSVHKIAAKAKNGSN
jgi:hypothetical protein